MLCELHGPLQLVQLGIQCVNISLRSSRVGCVIVHCGLLDFLAELRLHNFGPQFSGLEGVIVYHLGEWLVEVYEDTDIK
jgi:hypothetical protein